MLRNFTRTLVKKDIRNQVRRNFSEMSISSFLSAGDGLFLAALAAYSSFGVWVLKIQQGIDKLSTEAKEMRMEAKEMRMETKQSFDKLEMQMKESSEKFNNRIDEVLLRSLDLPRVK